MKKSYFYFIFVFTSCLSLYSQANFNNATLNGPWLFYKDVTPIDPYNDNLAYFIFDGNGNITGFNGFRNPTSANWGTYTVYPNGQFIGSFVIDSQTYPIGGTLTSSSDGNTTFNGNPYLYHKISNPGALSKRISGTLASNPFSDCGSKTITLDINSNGEVTASTGISGPVTGNAYSDLGVFIGHFYSADTQQGWHEFSIFGYYSNNNLIGKVEIEVGSTGLCNQNTSATLVRTDNLAIDDFVNSTEKVIFYPNPSEGNFNFYIQEPKSKLEISIFNFLGQKVFETINTDMKSDNKIEFEPKAKGMYLIKIYDGEKEYSEKVMIK